MEKLQTIIDSHLTLDSTAGVEENNNTVEEH